jgi:hypothetical protein
METTVPVTVIPNSKVNNNERRARNYTRGLFYYLGFLTLLAGLVLAIISIVKDDLTKMKFHLITSNYSQYCGWQNTHYYTTDTAVSGASTVSYANVCKDSSQGCKLERIGKAWYSLLIIGIVFAGLALIAYVFDFTHPLTWILIMLFDFLFFACMLAAVLTWGITKPCHKACHQLNMFSNSANIIGCRAHFAISWILAVIAGGLGLISLLCVAISAATRKRY